MNVSPENVHRHADRLDAIADEVGAARSAAGIPQSGAYGRLCAVVPVLLAELQTPLTDTIATAKQSIRDAAETLREAASLYASTDEAAAFSLRQDGGG
ncbi:type VII secretion target [Actinoplanes sp. GCM10030250]